MMRAAALFSAALALPLHAEGLPVFDETLGFEILGAVLDDGLLVNNGGHGFYCDVDDTHKNTHLILGYCTPIIGPKAAAALELPAVSDLSEQDFLAGLEALPELAFTPAIADALHEMGCVIDFNGGERVFVAEVADQLAKTAGYTGEMTDKIVDVVEDLAEDAAEAMVEQGRIVVDRNAKIATFTECQ